MKIGINDKFEIKQINNITDQTLNVVELDEQDDNFAFGNKDFWTDEVLLTYCYEQIIKDANIVEIKIYKQPKENK